MVRNLRKTLAKGAVNSANLLYEPRIFSHRKGCPGSLWLPALFDLGTCFTWFTLGGRVGPYVSEIDELKWLKPLVGFRKIRVSVRTRMLGF